MSSTETQPQQTRPRAEREQAKETGEGEGRDLDCSFQDNKKEMRISPKRQSYEFLETSVFARSQTTETSTDFASKDKQERGGEGRRETPVFPLEYDTKEMGCARRASLDRLTPEIETEKPDFALENKLTKEEIEGIKHKRILGK